MKKTLLTLSVGALIGIPGIWSYSGRGASAEPEGTLSEASSFEEILADANWDSEDFAGLSEEAVSVSSQSSHPFVLGGDAQDIYLYLALRAADQIPQQRPGMNLALVIDRSGSMASEDKLRFAKSAAEQLVGRLDPNDTLSIVAYDDVIQTLVPSTRVSARDVFLEAIRSLESGNSTDLNGGMMCGYEQVLEHFDGELLNRVLLISDGLANAGVSDSNAIIANAARGREQGVCISTMGMGLAYDEDLLTGIAQHAGGSYYYVDKAESVGRHLDREIDQLSKVVARNPKLTLELGEGVALAEVFGYVHTRTGKAARIPLNDLYSGERRKVVVRLRVQGEPGSKRSLAKVRLEYDGVDGGGVRILENPSLEVSFTDSIAKVERSREESVLTKVEVVHNAVALDTAMRLQKEGHFEAAQELLSARYRNSKTFNDTELHSDEVTRILNRIKQVMLELERTRSDPSARRDLQLRTQLRALGYVR